MKGPIKIILALLLIAATVAVCACGSKGKTQGLKDYGQDNAALTFDNGKWNYDVGNDVYWQVKVSYCSDPETEEYETMGIYVPGAYMNGKKNGDGTYTCTVNNEETVKGYTGETAPIVFPVNTAGYSAQAAPGEYSYDAVSDYLKAGFVYVYSGMRGRDNGYDDSGKLTYSGGAPWGVTDLKAAVRYYRYNAANLPGDTERIFTFGHSGGGAQSSLMGATGDSELYYDYLTSIGAAMFDSEGNYLSDAICGAMCWCPITSLDYADAAYEWNMGQYSSEDTRKDSTWTSALSDDLAASYADYINDLRLVDEEGNSLTLEKSAEDIYTSGSYYDYLLGLVEKSLNNFLSDTEFPYTETSMKEQADSGFGGGNQQPPKGEEKKGNPPDLPKGAASGQKPDGNPPDGKIKSEGSSGKTYKTVQAYIADLNGDGEWVKYDEKTGKATITSLGDFVKHCKQAAKSVGAFDDTKRSQAENKLFGNDDSDALHFDSVMAKLLEKNQSRYAALDDWDSSLIKEYANDLTKTDKLGNDSQTRQNMYNPMYFLSDYYEGNGSSIVAPYWRIRTGIEQSDTALTVETNLALALRQNDAVKAVDFETVWKQGHTTAERSGDSTDNFIQWVNSCLK
ncbi:S9 family peptidase [Anaerovorax odorimutans]|uniref:S9 family peptidase n=1 Tax=Anaerovorax odorimutans TaxID=109327 RepID=A0ABT1RNU9_9FIRM|nr:subtype A tannase [Anaerovorax odorimutans]MCQ4636857.1 S9 family peptidase [Anaerovorax odorimutans]